MSGQVEPAQMPVQADVVQLSQLVQHALSNALNCSNHVTNVADGVPDKMVAIAEWQAARLARKSVEVAEVAGISTVDKVHVNQADLELNSYEMAGRISSWLLAVGGLLLGIAATLAVGIVAMPSPSMPWAWWSATVICAIVGLGVLAGTFPRKSQYAKNSFHT